MICFISIIGLAQKKIYWIHGLNENKEFWQRYRSSISNIYAGNEISWKNQQQIATIANQTSREITTNAVLIGHSTGGLIARTIQKSNTNVKAIITIGTPNQGAGIVKSLNNKSYYNVIDEVGYKGGRAVDKSLSAAIKCAPPISWAVAPIINLARGAATITINGFATGMAKKYADNYVNTYYANDQTVKDMNPGSSFLNDINNSYINVPIINIYGEEDYWQVVRLGGSMANRNKVVSYDNTTDRTYDEEYFTIVRKIQGVISDVCRYHDDVYQALKWPAIIMPWIWGTREYVLSAKHEWESVDRYLTYDIHNSYSTLIGAFHYETRTYTTGWWIFRKTYTTTVPIYENHDGLIANKDSHIPTNKGVNVRNVIIKGVNHMEMSGHPLMRQELNRIINGLEGGNYDPVFRPN